MRDFSQGSLQLDIVISILVFIFTTTLTLHLYAKAMHSERNDQNIVSNVPFGKSRYALIQEGDKREGNDRCVGRVNVDVFENDLLEIHAKGAVRVQLNSIVRKATFSYAAYVNPLGQMFRSRLKFDFLDTSFSLDARDVRPITIDFVAQSKDKSYDREIHMPGFISVEKSSDTQMLTIEYSHASMLRDSTQPFQFSLFQNPLRLRMRAENENQILCKGDQVAALDVGPVLAEFSKLAKTLHKFLPNTF